MKEEVLNVVKENYLCSFTVILKGFFFLPDGVTQPAVPLVATRRKSIQAVSATNKNLTLTDSSGAEKLNVLSFEAENRLHYKNYSYSTLVVLW